MAEITNQEVLAQIKELMSKTEGMQLERINDLGPGGQVAFCCGCVCISKCVANSAAAMREFRILVAKGEIGLPESLNKLLLTEIGG